MTRLFGLRARAIAACLALVSAGLLPHREADACGRFALRGEDAPTVGVERVLLVHDEAKGIEHFVREVVFEDTKESFGFVVPTPSKPTVAKVDDLDWARLERDHRFDVPRERGGSGALGRLGGAGSVVVLEHKRVGSFASYVLEADSGEAMKNWLEKNRFETTPASRSWLDHYIGLGFYFVALRFEPALARRTRRAAGDFNLDRGGAETVRISFETPVPYYPYQEPEETASASDRMLALWLLTSSRKVPVALKTGGDAPSYVRPWREGMRATFDPAKPLTGAKTWKVIAPSGPLVLQVFEDQKRSRAGFGDVVLLPEEKAPLDEVALARRKRFMALLDPASAH